MLMSQFSTSMEVTVPDQSYDLSELLFHLYRKMIALGVYFRTKVSDLESKVKVIKNILGLIKPFPLSFFDGG